MILHHDTFTRAQRTEDDPAPPAGPCEHCLFDDHHLCVGVACYNCTDPTHDRKPGNPTTGHKDMADG